MLPQPATTISPGLGKLPRGGPTEVRVLNRQELIDKLNWFYSLELSQVDLYTAQSKNAEDIYLRKVLERVAAIEQQHVDNLAAKIKQLGGKPTFLGERVAPITGKIMGRATAWAGMVAALKADIALEERAMRDYKEFILQAGGVADLFDLLWANLIDEDLHAAWFANKVKELTGRG